MGLTSLAVMKKQLQVFLHIHCDSQAFVHWRVNKYDASLKLMVVVSSSEDQPSRFILDMLHVRSILKSQSFHTLTYNEELQYSWQVDGMPILSNFLHMSGSQVAASSID